MGSAYRPDDLQRALADRRLVELDMMIRPSEDLALYRAEMADWPGEGPLTDWEEDVVAWVEANDACRRDILDRSRRPVRCRRRDLPDSCVVAVAVQRMERPPQRRPDAHADGPSRRGRGGRPSRAVTGSGTSPTGCSRTTTSSRSRTRCTCGTSGCSGHSASPAPGCVGSAGRTRGRGQVSRASGGSTRRSSTTSSRAAPRCCRRWTAWCSTASGWPSCSSSTTSWRCTSRRRRRRWGYWALPVLHHDRLVGKVDATADRKAGRSGWPPSTRTSPSAPG